MIKLFWDISVHAAIIAINEAIETQVTADIMAALGNPSANLVGVEAVLAENYTTDLYNAKQTKMENAKNKVLILTLSPIQQSCSR